MKAYTIAYVPHEDDEENAEYTLGCVFVGQALAQQHANIVAAEHMNDRGTFEVREVSVYEDLPQKSSQYVMNGKVDENGNLFDHRFTEYKSWEYEHITMSRSGYHSVSKNFKDGSYFAVFSLRGDTPEECEQLLERRKKQMIGDIQTRIKNAQKKINKATPPTKKITLPNAF